MYSNKLINELIADFRAYERGEGEALTYDQCQVLLNSEEHEAFIYDYGLYQDIMNFRDHLELEMDDDLDGYYENQRIQAYNA